MPRAWSVTDLGGLSFVFNGLLWWAVKDSSGDAGLATDKALFLTGYLIEIPLARWTTFLSS